MSFNKINFAPVMEKKHSYFNVLVSFLLVIGFQFFGNQSMLYAASSSSTVLVDTIESNVSLEVQKDQVDSSISTTQQLLVEIEEEVLEERKDVKIRTHNAVFHTFYTAFLELLFCIYNKVMHSFEASKLVSSIPLYLQHEVFRL